MKLMLKKRIKKKAQEIQAFLEYVKLEFRENKDLILVVAEIALIAIEIITILR